MSEQKKRRKQYIPPRLAVDIIEFESSIAASSAMVSPGGDTVGSNPWITDETEEVIHKEWDFQD
ncbi:hypothetical protein GQF61_02280 [Sphingobacterium sp. DK4209]|uniref:Uncharacterized protein n=1 Tax=Sphingobacterium zhuxiongii TaxID=2662364 RepID=A0A5Q0QBR6_9SPHI|nr:MULTISPECIES: hypothetical protein [unclassified Sphingobacterium]MVZ64665.1 hypothetical protein [Sphingobacterium sp. DK4209]QGA27003.1 hypothetical protein GFH32_12035 [Sphingobacterium sp. dk4302]